MVRLLFINYVHFISVNTETHFGSSRDQEEIELLQKFSANSYTCSLYLWIKSTIMNLKMKPIEYIVTAKEK